MIIPPLPKDNRSDDFGGILLILCCPEKDEIPSEQEREAAEDVFSRYSDELESIKGVEGSGFTFLKDKRTAILLKLYPDAPTETESLVSVKIEGVFIICDRNSNVAGCCAPSRKLLSQEK